MRSEALMLSAVLFKPLKAPRLAAVFGDACSRTELASSLRDGVRV